MDNTNRFPEGDSQRAMVPRSIAPAQYIDLPPVMAEPQEDPNSVNLAEYWQAFIEGRWILMTGAFLGTVLGFLSIVPQPLVYEARTTLEVQGVNERFMNMSQLNPQDLDAYSASQVNIQTQLKILQSESLRTQAAEKVQQTSVPPAPPQSGLVNEMRNRLNVVPQEPVMFMQEALEMATNSVTARAFGPTRIIEIRCESISPDVAARYANGLANEFIEHSLEARLTSAQRTSRWLSDQLEESKKKLEQSENKLQEYARRSGLLMVGQQDTLAEAKLRELQLRVSSIQTDRISKQSKYEMAVAAPLDAPPSETDDQTLSSLRSEYAALRRQIADLRTTLTPAHARMKRLDAQLAEVESSLIKARENQIRRLKNDYETALRQEKLLANAYGGQSRVVTSQADRTVQYNMLNREAETNRQSYNTLLQQVGQAGIAVAMPNQNVRIIDPARPPRRPQKPKAIVNTGIGLVFGLASGLGIVFLRKQSDRRVTKPFQAATLLNVAELGVIPSARFSANQSLFERLRSRSSRGSESLLNGKRTITDQRVELATWHQQPSLLAESFRAVLASILFENVRGYRPRVIVLTKPGSEEGKTTVASNLAIAIAETKRRVLLIDADLRRPRLHAVFDLANSWGLSNVIQDRQPVSEYPLEALVRETEIPGLDLLASGPATLSVSNLLYSPRTRELLERFRREYDAVLIDTPPMVQFSDARVMGRLADGAIIVLRAGQTDQASAMISRRHFDEDGTPVLGTILNDWYPTEKHAKQYRNYYQHY